jgi:hypothetical protein
MGGSEIVQGITKHEVIIQVNPIRPTHYTTVRVKEMVMLARSYDVLVEGAILYPWESPWIFGKGLFIINHDGKREISLRL